MPFTPFHLGPALAIGLPLRRFIHVPTFIVANVIVDVEPFLVMVLGLNYPLHGYLHTFIGAFAVGLVLAYVMYLIDRFVCRLWSKLLLISKGSYSLKEYVIAGVSGTLMHVLLDSPLYTDIRPLYPLTLNPLYDPTSLAQVSIFIYDLCTVMVFAGLIYYYYLLVRASFRKALSILGILYVVGFVISFMESYVIPLMVFSSIVFLVIALLLLIPTLRGLRGYLALLAGNVLAMVWLSYLLSSGVTFSFARLFSLIATLAAISLIVAHVVNITMILRYRVRT